MTLRILRIITLTFVSHLLIAPLAFTSQLPALSSSDAAGVDGAVAPQRSQEVTIKSRQQEKQGDLYKADGDVEISFQSYVLRAEHGTYNAASGEVIASGRVVFEGGSHDAYITASHASYNVRSETGIFYDVAGTFGAVARGQSVVLTTSNPFVIAGREVQKVGRDRYVVLHGSITSCAEQTPTWTFNSEKIDVVPGEDAKLYHSSFRLLKLPIFYFPYNKVPANAMGRTSGLLLPEVGQSSTKGFVLGDSVYWAINRSSDITVGAQYFSLRGWSETVHIRVKPGEHSSLEVHYFGVQDRGAPVTHQDQGGEEVTLIGDTSADHWRAAANIDYLSSFLFRQAFSETFSQAVNSEVRSVAFLSHNVGGLSLNASASRYQNFFQNPLTSTFSDQIKILHLPMVELNGLEKHVLSSPVVWGVDASAAGLQRSEPGFVTATLVGRFDLRPQIAMPLQWRGWEVRPQVALHDTLYSQQLSGVTAANPLGVASGTGIHRRDVESLIELRPPPMEKTFNREIFGRRLKHAFEPIFRYRYTTGIHNFQNIIRFDQTDILSNTSEFEYDVIQRIYGRRRSTHHEAGCEAAVQPPAGRKEKLPPAYIPGVTELRPHCEDESKTTRQLLSWEVKQKYYVNETFGGALVTGRRNVFTTTEDLTGIAFLDGPRTWSPVVSKLRIETSANTDVQWQLDYDPVRGRINSSALFADYRVGEYFVGLSHSFFHVPSEPVAETFSNEPQVFDQFRYLVGYGHPNKRGFSGAFSMGYDEDLNFLQYAAVQSSYNWDCCGISAEYRHIDVPGVNVENQYRFSFSLANFGTFGNMKRQERLY